VFSPFSRAWLRTFAPSKPLPAPRTLPPVTDDIVDQSVPMPSCEDLGIAPNPQLHYMKHLTDGDWAQNNADWQWLLRTSKEPGRER